MNEKIVELLTKEGFLDEDGDPVTDFKPRHLVDLIESVVRECARLNFKATGEVTTDGEIAVSNLILNHFGVEE